MTGDDQGIGGDFSVDFVQGIPTSAQMEDISSGFPGAKLVAKRLHRFVEQFQRLICEIRVHLKVVFKS